MYIWAVKIGAIHFFQFIVWKREREKKETDIQKIPGIERKENKKFPGEERKKMGTRRQPWAVGGAN